MASSTNNSVTDRTSTVQATPGTSVVSGSASHVAFWNDETVDLNPSRMKKQVPVLPTVDTILPTVKGSGVETLAYLALQIIKTNDKVVTMRAIASACSTLFGDSKNYLGCQNNAVPLTGLAVAQESDSQNTSTLETNFEDAEPVSVKELLETMEADGDELGAYFGVLFLAGNKRVTAQNRSAFNERRRASATASLVTDPKIFIPDSPFLDDRVLIRVYASFLSFSPLRAHMTANIVNKLSGGLMGPALSFASMFLLLVDSGMSALRIIKEAVLKHPWIRTEFPELRPEFAAANEAQTILKNAPAKTRSFLKAIHGNAFVPVSYTEIDNLTGVCKEILKRTTPSYQNYGGGKVTEQQMQRINSHADVSDVTPGSNIAAE